MFLYTNNKLVTDFQPASPVKTRSLHPNNGLLLEAIVRAERLRRRHGSKGLRNLLFPRQSRLAKDLSHGLEFLDAFGQDSGAKNDLVVAHYFLVVIDVRGAVGAIVTVDALA